MDQTFDVITSPTKSDDVTKTETTQNDDLTPTKSSDVTKSSTIISDIKSNETTSIAPQTQDVSSSDDNVDDITGGRTDSVFTKLRSSPRLSASKRSIFEPVHEVCGKSQHILRHVIFFFITLFSTISFGFFDS